SFLLAVSSSQFPPGSFLLAVSSWQFPPRSFLLLVLMHIHLHSAHPTFIVQGHPDVLLIFRIACIHARPRRRCARHEHAAERAHAARRNHATRGIVVVHAQPIHVLCIDRQTKSPEVSLHRHARRLAVLVH